MLTIDLVLTEKIYSAESEQVASSGEDVEQGASNNEIGQHLLDIGIGASVSTVYAKALSEDGFETAELFASLSLTDLRDDYGFKRGHLMAVDKFRSAQNSRQASTAVPAAPVDGVPAPRQATVTAATPGFSTSGTGPEANPGPESERAADTSQVGAAPKAELASMKYSELEDLAESLGATSAQLEEIEDSEGNPKEELRSLVVSLKQKAQAQP